MDKVKPLNGPLKLEARADRRTPRLIVPARNLIIRRLSQVQSNQLIELAEPVNLKAREVLYESGEDIHFAYFPIDCVISSLALLEDGSTVEIAMIGREGLVGLPVLIGGGRALHWTRVSVAGAALCVPVAALEDLADTHDGLQRAILESYRNLFRQICQRSVCNVRHTLLSRLCVWLLMMHDRVGSDELPLTQEEIAGRIGVRRAGVSVTTSMLQSMRVIASRRGKIAILDRGRLERTACECYAIMKQDFQAASGGLKRDRVSAKLKARPHAHPHSQ